jgi:hypothetical protein
MALWLGPGLEHVSHLFASLAREWVEYCRTLDRALERHAATIHPSLHVWVRVVAAPYLAVAVLGVCSRLSYFMHGWCMFPSPTGVDADGSVPCKRSRQDEVLSAALGSCMIDRALQRRDASRLRSCRRRSEDRSMWRKAMHQPLILAVHALAPTVPPRGSHQSTTSLSSDTSNAHILCQTHSLPRPARLFAFADPSLA